MSFSLSNRLLALLRQPRKRTAAKRLVPASLLTARPARPVPRRANLQLEVLEDRLALSTISPVQSSLLLVPSTASYVASALPTAPSTPVRFTTPSGSSASQSGSALTINVAGGETTLTLSSNGAGLIELSDSSQSDFAQFRIASINAVFINLGRPQNGYLVQFQVAGFAMQPGA